MMASKVRRSPLARGLILVIASAMVISLALGAIWLDGWLGLQLPSGLRWPGMAVLACGLVLIVWAEVTLLRIARSTGAFGDPPGRLVAQGPYRQVRNPIYIGAFGVLLGLSWWRSSPTLLVLALGFLPVMHLIVTRSEEPATRRRLGAQYDDYLRRVPRWLPRLRRRVDGV
jgi:protein-S-isoprenylcysteine O-methyltransferase Ste14